MRARDETAGPGARDGGAGRGAESARRAASPGHESFPLLTEAVSIDSAPLFAENLRRGAKPPEGWTCGVEFELFGYDASRRMARLDPAQVRVIMSHARAPRRAR